MGRADVNGVTLDYSIAGAGEPVVFIHGAFIADAFHPMLAEPVLASRFQLITYHRRGYGESDHRPGPTSIAQQAADCRALLAYLGIERAHVVGHSFGGIVALQLALDNPEAIHSLTLLEPGLMIGASAAAYREALARGSQRYREVGAAQAVDEFLRARWQQYREHLERIVPGAFAQAVADAGTWFETEAPAQLAWDFGTAEAAKIPQPAFSVLGGESEALWERFGETHRWLLTHLRRAEGLVVPGATHLMAFQRPSETAAGIASFLSRHPIPS